MTERTLSNQAGVSVVETERDAELWRRANALRGNVDSAEFKQDVLGLIFLKYISDACEQLHIQLELEQDQAMDAEAPHRHLAKNTFWAPKESRWEYIRANASKSRIGKVVDDAMIGIEKYNDTLTDALPKNYSRPSLDKTRLGQLVDLISSIRADEQESRPTDVVGRVFDYFFSKFSIVDGRKGGEFYTPKCVAKLLVEMIEPYGGQVYDPCCGASEKFVQLIAVMQTNENRRSPSEEADVSIFGQESSNMTWRLAKMNLAVHGIAGKIEYGNSLLNDRHPELKSDFVLASPPFNAKNWGGSRLREDERWKFGVPPASNANFAWLQHIYHHLAPDGFAGVVLANGSMSSTHSGEIEIRKAMIDADVVDCIIAMPGQLFYSTQIPSCLWILTKNKFENGNFRKRAGEILFVDARDFGHMADRTRRELSESEISRVSSTYHQWRQKRPELHAEKGGEPAYRDIAGFCKAVDARKIGKNNYALMPGRYVDVEVHDGDDAALEETILTLSRRLSTLQRDGAALNEGISLALRKLGV